MRWGASWGWLCATNYCREKKGINGGTTAIREEAIAVRIRGNIVPLLGAFRRRVAVFFQELYWFGSGDVVTEPWLLGSIFLTLGLVWVYVREYVITVCFTWHCRVYDIYVIGRKILNFVLFVFSWIWILIGKGRIWQIFGDAHYSKDISSIN